MFPIQSLLTKIQNRSFLHRGLLAAKVVEKTNQWIKEQIGHPQTEPQARAISFAKGVLLVECVNGGVVQYLHDHEFRLFEWLKKEIPTLPMSLRLQTRICPYLSYAP
ncbi:hypothetical protein CO172_00245 [Candidatus Uhrbacteria bacterium CG_4_9_14_3_um_filter_36_7]|uniref:DUF721 domain-containing protein n=1 Tax=Candidatus Uhrbacteria bacterium CG_4_9_14_3_um_filter_36_7 TaxID=1975033 RepID=A0A2M7XIE5_9BACT|nr:MAG: hypothetical protein CO172_00245 [Candidatus Uhrbacteria bacterium CG_4_9_14_3_um_filter_36_7]